MVILLPHSPAKVQLFQASDRRAVSTSSHIHLNWLRELHPLPKALDRLKEYLAETSQVKGSSNLHLLLVLLRRMQQETCRKQRKLSVKKTKKLPK